MTQQIELRDHFASLALQALVSQAGTANELTNGSTLIDQARQRGWNRKTNIHGLTLAELLAHESYLLADAMMTERAVREPNYAFGH